METMKRWIYVLLPLQLIILILSPRFGWKIHSPESTVLSYGGTTYTDGKIHVLYQDEKEKIDICYENIFSKQFLVTVNDHEEYAMTVEIDGKQTDSPNLRFTEGDMIWKDSLGIFGWRYILTIALTAASIILVKRTDRIQIFSCTLYAASILISLRVLF